MGLRALGALLALALAGCSVLDLSSSQKAEEDPALVAPAYRRVIAARLAYILGDPSRAGLLQISGVRRVNHVRGPSWLACVKVNSYSLPRIYAVFIQGEQMVESRLAILVDQCDQQAYEPFDWVAENKPAG